MALGRGPWARLPGAPKSTMSRSFFGSFPNGIGRIDAERPLQAFEHLGNQPLVALRPRADRAGGKRQGVVGHDARGVEVVDAAEPLAVRAGAVRRVERKRARRHLGDADATGRAGHPPREQAIPALERVDHDDVVGELEGEVDRIGQPPLDPRLDDQPIDEDVNGVVAAAVELDLVAVERDELAVDARAGEAAGAQGRQLALELALAAAHDGREHVDALVRRVEQHHVHDALERLRRDLAVAVRAMGDANVGEEQAKIVVDLGHRPDGRSRVGGGGLLFDGNRRREPVDQVDVRLLHLLEELPRVGRERLDVAALPFRIDGVEGQRRLARAGEAGDDHHPVAR